MKRKRESVFDLSFREKVLVTVSFTAGAFVVYSMYREYYKNYISVDYVNKQLGEMFEFGEIVGTGEHRDHILQFR